MGLYTINCPECKKLYSWFSGDVDQRCDECKKLKWSCEECALKEVDIDELKDLWIKEKDKVNRLMRSMDRIAGMCGIPNAADGCRAILKEYWRIKKGIEPEEND